LYKPPQSHKNRFTVNIALISIFSALWVVLNFTLAPIGFALTGLPVIHSVIIFFTLLLTVWATNQFGAASTVGVIGSAIVVLAGGPLPVLGFVPAAIILDLIFLVNRHVLNLKPQSIAVAALASIVCAYLGALVNGIVILKLPLAFVFTIWGAWTILGGVIGVVLTLPIIGALERAQVKKVQAE
jgi:hypothetical protein